MYKIARIGFVLLTCLLNSPSFYAQSPSDAIMMNTNQACILLDYNYSSFDHYWEGENKRKNQTIGTVERNSLMAMLAVGINDNLNVFIGVPYIETQSKEPNGGQLSGVSGFQDLAISLKYRWLNKKLKNSELTGLATIAFSTPATNYLPDYMPYSLGLGAPELSYRAILQYGLSNNWYIRGTGAFLWRGYAKAEREYYYNNGSYYTPWMDVPNASTTEIIIGKWVFDNSLQLELNYFGSKSLSGDDIRPYAAPQPTNKVDIDRIGLFVHYYIPSIKGLGIVAYHNKVINGRNTAEMNTTGFGLTYFFNYSKILKNEK